MNAEYEVEVLAVNVDAERVVSVHQGLVERRSAPAKGVADDDARRSSMRSANVEPSSVTFSSSLVNCSLVLPEYFWIVSRSSSKWASGLRRTGRNRSPTRSKRAYADERLDRYAMSWLRQAVRLLTKPR